MATGTEPTPFALVVDCAVSLSWFLPEGPNELAERLLARLADLDVWVPAIWCLEFANGLNVALRRERIDATYRARVLESAELLPISIDLEPPPLTVIAELAALDGLTTYDAAYLELALRRGLPLATLDADLGAAAERHGVRFATAE